jgi:hypothetical protein
MTGRGENGGLAHKVLRTSAQVAAPLEIEETFVACVESLRSRLPLDSLPRELHHQIILDDEAIEPVRFFLHGRSGLPLSSLQLLKRIRLRESRALTAGGAERTYLELTAKSSKRHDKRGRKVVRDEVTVPLSPIEFAAWSSHSKVVGKLTKLRLRLPAKKGRTGTPRLAAEIDYLLDAGPDAVRAPVSVLRRRVLPRPLLQVCLIDCEYPSESAVIGDSLSRWPEISSAALAASDEDHPHLKFLRKGYLAKHGITADVHKAQLFALSLINSRIAR